MHERPQTHSSTVHRRTESAQEEAQLRIVVEIEVMRSEAENNHHAQKGEPSNDVSSIDMLTIPSWREDQIALIERGRGEIEIRERRGTDQNAVEEAAGEDSARIDANQRRVDTPDPENG